MEFFEFKHIFDYSANEVLSDNKSNTLRQTIKEELLVLEIPPLVVDEVIDSEELDVVISNYIYNYTQYIIYNANKPAFPSQNIMNILLEKYNTQEEKNLSRKQIEKILNYVKLLGNRIDQSLLNQSEVDEMVSLNIIKKIAVVFNSKFITIVMVVIMTILIAIISICLKSIKKAINWCSKITILDGVFLIIASFVEVRLLIMYFNSQGLIDSLAISIVENGFQNMLVYGIALIVIGIVFMSISGILLKKEQNNKSKPLSHSIEREPKKAVIKENEVLQAITDEKKEVVEKPKEELKNNNQETKEKHEEPKKEEKVDNNQNKNQENNKQPEQKQDNKSEIKPENNNQNKHEEPKKEQNNNQKPEEKPKEEPKNNNQNNNNKENKQPEQKQDNKPEIKVENNKQNNQEESKKNQNNNQNNNNNKQNKLKNIKDETKIVPAVEEPKEEVKEDKPKFIELEKVSEEEVKSEKEPDTTKYSEISDKKDTEPVKDNKIQAKPLNTAQLNITFPKIGKPIEPEPNKQQDDDEDIELL